MLDPNVSWEIWKTRLLNVADSHVPPIMKKVRSQHAPWITQNIRQVMRQRDFLKKKAIKTGLHHLPFIKRKKNFIKIFLHLRKYKSDFQ